MHRYSLIFALIGGLALGICVGSVSGPAIASRARARIEAAAPGWPGATAQYLGRYRLTSSSNPGLARQGQLTVFLRTVSGQNAPVLSGILALHGADATNVFYLTRFAHSGSRLWATVNLGLYTGPVVGKFAVASYDHHRMTASLAIQGGAKLTLHLARYSANPHP